MDLIEFFNSNELELPRTWDAFTGSFDQYTNHIFDAYLQAYRQIMPNDYLSNRIANEYNAAVAIRDAMLQCITEYFLGHPPRAYKPLVDALQIAQNHFQAMFSVANIATVINHLYRIRSDTPPAPRSPQDMFHVPFQDRHKVATYRYSILGLPCLYLGSSAYVCWEEYNRPHLDSLYIARFEPITGATFQVLDFGWRPAWFAALLASGTHQNDLNQPSRLTDLITAQAVCWPILASSSIKVKHRNAPFKPEYVIPQLILQWLTSETTIDGVRYFSTKVQNYFNNPAPASNFVLPARSTKPAGHCDQLAAKFQLTDPVHWPSVQATVPPINTAPNTGFQLDYPPGSPPVPYLQTDLGKFQLHAAGRPRTQI